MISFSSLVIGNTYDRPFLANLWGYAGHQALSRGIVTPSDTNIIILFITKNNQVCLTKYNNNFYENSNLLYMNGEINHQNDERLVNSSNTGDEVYLFYREKHHSNFMYKGRVYLSDYTINSNLPSNFIFSTSSLIANAYTSILTDNECFKEATEAYFSENEGKLKVIQTTVHERSIRNRTKALEIHGSNCYVCGFNFNDFYGPNLAKDYIEVHHIKPVSKFEGEVNPKTDLFPVCPNCHRMLHRKKNKLLSIEELKDIINNNSK